MLMGLKTRIPAGFDLPVLAPDGIGYQTTVQTDAEPFSVAKWFERLGLMVTKMETMTSPMQVEFRE